MSVWPVLGALLAPAIVWLATLCVVTLTYVRRALFFWRFPPPEPVGARALARILLLETTSAARVLAWSLVRRGESMNRTDGDTVALIHGLSADGTSMYAFRKRLHARGRRTMAPHLGRIMRPIDRYAERLAAELSLIDRPFDVIAHSMGGVVLRAALVIAPALRARIRRVVCVASPHDGTGSARFLPLPEARQLVPGSPWLKALPSLRELLPHTEITTVSSVADAVVYPSKTTHVDGATAHDLEGLGHAETLVHPRVLDLVMQALP